MKVRMSSFESKQLETNQKIETVEAKQVGVEARMEKIEARLEEVAANGSSSKVVWEELKEHKKG